MFSSRTVIIIRECHFTPKYVGGVVNEFRGRGLRNYPRGMASFAAVSRFCRTSRIQRYLYKSTSAESLKTGNGGKNRRSKVPFTSSERPRREGRGRKDRERREKILKETAEQEKADLPDLRKRKRMADPVAWSATKAEALLLYKDGEAVAYSSSERYVPANPINYVRVISVKSIHKWMKMTRRKTSKCG